MSKGNILLQSFSGNKVEFRLDEEDGTQKDQHQTDNNKPGNSA